jgi:hypothetical protein
MGRLICYVWIVFVTGTLVVLRAMSFPVTKAHPAKVMLATVALHVIAATIFLNANMALWALKQQGRLIKLKNMANTNYKCINQVEFYDLKIW